MTGSCAGTYASRYRHTADCCRPCLTEVRSEYAARPARKCKLVPLVVFLFSLDGYKTRVSGECAYATGGITCSVEHRSGGGSVHVTWDALGSCGNGTGFQVRPWQNIDFGTRETRFIPQQNIKHFELCDQIVAVKVENVRIEPL